MEAAAISLAISTLNLVVKTAAAGLTQEFGSLLDVQEELLFIKHEFEMMQVILQDASTEHVESNVMTTWIQQVKELAMDLEDCLQEASVHLMENSCLLAMFSLKKQDRIARNIRALKARTSDAIDRIQCYNQIKNIYGGHRSEEIGLDEPKRKLVELILKEDGEVISVVGMGGLGKTTLAREVYGCQEVRDNFKHFAWVTIQHPFSTEEFIESLAKQIPSNLEDNKWELSSKKTLKEKVTEYLKDKKYFVVLDDLSSLSEWDVIKDVLSLANGNRIIVTTRYKSPLVEAITHTSENIYEIKKLSEEDAFDLFCKAVYKTSNYRLVSDEGPSSTERTEDDIKVQSQFITNTISEEEYSKVQEQSTTIPFTKDMDTNARLIIESCGRLPLAIVTIGSYLATKPKTSAEWMKMHNQLISELTSNPELGVVKTVLTSSYDGMPKHLKQSLMYLSVFHNHKEIRPSRIIRRWMADEVIKDGMKTAEEIGMDYFYDLIGRSLIQPSQMSTNINGDINRCNIHDILYGLILAKAEKEKMVSVLNDENNGIKIDKVIRHLVIIGGAYKRNRVLERMNLSRVQSVSIFGKVRDDLRYSKLNLVRVLDLEGTFDLHNRNLRSVGKLRYLKYLGLRGTTITKIPNSLGKLRELETLDIRNTAVVQLPTGLTKLLKLSYLRAGCDLYNNQNIKQCKKHYGSVGVMTPRGIGKLWYSLNILGMIDIGRSNNFVMELQNLTNLRKLAVTGFSKENGKRLARVIDELEHLRSLVLSATDDLGLRCCLESVSCPPKYLKSLKLHSPLLELPDWISSLENLGKIHLRNTVLMRRIKAIGKLPNLQILYLLDNSFEDVEELYFGEGTFPMLQVLIIEAWVESVSIEKTALKRLELLRIRNWEGGVSGLDFLEQLKEMEVVLMYSDDSESDIMFVGNIEEQLKKLPKQPVLKVSKR